MKTEVLISPLESLAAELLVTFAANASESTEKDAKPEVVLLAADSAAAKAAAGVLALGDFKAEANETLLVHAPSGLAAKRLLLVGLGKKKKAGANELRKAAGTAVRFAKSKGIRSLALGLPNDAGIDASAAARAIGEGAVIGEYDSDTYRTDRKDRSIDSLSLIAPAASKDTAAAGLREGVILAESQNFARVLINEPGNYLTPTILGQRAKAMADEFGLKCEVSSTEKMQELKMGAFLSVAQGSAEPPALIVLTYEPEGAAGESKGTAAGPVLGLVGKGVTFDTGGISIKPADNMEKMKYDMAGGAAMLGAMRAIAQLKPKVKVICVVCATENMPDGKAQKPGDVQIAMSGKSIEVINTDAEGRLVLADGLHYAKTLGATHLINAATLTGAVAIALGRINAGSFSNDDEAYEKFNAGLATSGERFWRLPCDDEYRGQIKSSIADIQNTGLTRYGGAINGAMFLKEFVGETPWIHLDIAAMAWLDSDESWIARGPSGFAVRSVFEWVRSYAK